MALFLTIIIVFSVMLKGLTHLLTLGYLPSPVFANLLPHDGVYPAKEDDFGIFLLKLGTACIESTQYSGLRNELAGIEEKRGPWVEINAAGSDLYRPIAIHARGFATEINDVEVNEAVDPQMESLYWRETKSFWSACGQALVASAWMVLLKTPGGKALWDWSQHVRQRYRLPRRTWRIWQLDAWRWPRPQMAVQSAVTDPTSRVENSNGVSTSVSLRHTPGPIQVQYADFLRGGADIEDDEGEWQEETDDGSESSEGSSEADDESGLYRDLFAPVDEAESGLQPVLLAHLTNSSIPLTRRRYASMLTSSSSSIAPEGLRDIVEDRRASAATRDRDQWDEERRRNCVVCTVEQRDTILWPCRCLAMCNECRENLAARLAASEHVCPCCRRKWVPLIAS